jgi:uncharacterized protein YacL
VKKNKLTVKLLLEKILKSEKLNLKNGFINFLFTKWMVFFYMVKFVFFLVFLGFLFKFIAGIFHFMNNFIFYKPYSNLPYIISGLVIGLVIISLWDMILKYFKFRK